MYKKIFLALLLGVLINIFSIVNVYALTGWVEKNGNKYYYDKSGNMLIGVQEIDGKRYLLGNPSGKLYYGLTKAPDGYTYYSNSKGIIQTGWIVIDNDKYYFDELGHMSKGWIEINDLKYYFNEDGKMLKGIQSIDGKRYLLGNPSGKLYYGWTRGTDGHMYYSDSDGVILTGVQEIDGKRYLLGNPSGKLYYGLTKAPDGYTYYSDESGIIQTGWIVIDDDKYYFDELGHMSKGWIEINDLKYYFNEDGKMLKGIQEIDGKRYLLGNPSGKLYYGWTRGTDGHMYYSDSDGIILTGVQEIDEKRYLLGNPSGKLYYGFTKAPDGYTYYSDEEGVIQTGWLIVNNDKYYFDELGHMSKGWTAIGEYKYYFDEDGKMLKGIQSIDGKRYFLNYDNGELCFGWNNDLVGNTYYSDNDGMILTGVQEIDGKRYLLGNPSGKLYYGFTKAPDGYTYYSDEEGVIQTGWLIVNNDKYYFDELGHMSIGWTDIGDYKYYFDKNGKMLRGVQTIDGKKYLLGNPSGKLYYGWTNAPDGNTYYSDSDGVILTGIQEIDGKRYLLGNPSGRLYIGWTRGTDGEIYYTDSTGVIQVGEQFIDNSWYLFDDYGRLKNGWQTINGVKHYIYSDGKQATGIVKIAGIRYEFSKTGELLHSNIKLILDVSAWQGTIDWDKLWNSGSIDGVILRMGFGDSDEDRKFSEYISNVKRLKIPYSVYWFSYAKTVKEAQTEANYTASLYKKYNLSPTFKVYYDLEDWEYSNQTVNSYDISKDTYQQIASTYINTLKKNNINVGIYANTYFYNNRFTDETRAYVEWIANYSASTCPGNFRGWQYTSKGSVPGISGNVDLSVFYW